MSSSPIKESSPPKTDKAVFTDKEEKVLKVAWHCLKAPPEIDIEKLRVMAEFNTAKTAQNTWGVIKKKLATLAPPAGEDDDATSTPKTKATPKKRSRKAAAADGEADDDEVETPVKKRKTPKKVKAGQDELVGDDAVKSEGVEED